jgi:hypothetical protein
MFQATVNSQPAPAESGDFASANPRASVLAGPGQLVVPAGGLTVGAFAFVNPTTGVVTQSYSSGDLIGFVSRRQDGLITVFLAESVYTLQPGFPLTLMDGGDYWAKFAVAAPTPGVPVYANTTTGAAQVSATAGVKTQFVLASVAGAGEVAKISTTTVAGA